MVFCNSRLGLSRVGHLIWPFNSALFEFDSKRINNSRFRALSDDINPSTSDMSLPGEAVNLEERDAAIEAKRNKSRLSAADRNFLFESVPYPDGPVAEGHCTVKYNRKLYGRYGHVSGVYPGIMWPTMDDLNDRKEYESVAYPFTIQEMINKESQRIEKKKLKIQEKQCKILTNLAKLDQWKKDLHTKMSNKLAEANALKEKKDKLIEDVRRHFGYKVDPREERFQEMLALKEKQQKKTDKEARIKARQEKTIAKLLSKDEVKSETET